MEVTISICSRKPPRKTERKEVLSHWMEPGHELQFRVPVFVLTWFSFVSCQTVQQCSPAPALCQFKKMWDRLTSVLSSGRFFYFFLFCCKIFVMAVIKELLYCCVADKWHSVGEKCFSCRLSLRKRQEVNFIPCTVLNFSVGLIETQLNLNKTCLSLHLISLRTLR